VPEQAQHCWKQLAIGTRQIVACMGTYQCVPGSLSSTHTEVWKRG